MSGASPSGTLVAHLFALALEMVGFWRGHELADYSFQMFHAHQGSQSQSPRPLLSIGQWSLDVALTQVVMLPLMLCDAALDVFAFVWNVRYQKESESPKEAMMVDVTNSYSSPFVRTRYFPKSTLDVLQEPTTPFRSKSLYCSPLRKSLGATASLRHLVSIDAFPVPSFLLCQD